MRNSQIAFGNIDCLAKLWLGGCSVSLTEVALVRVGRNVELRYDEDYRSKVFPVVRLGSFVLADIIVAYRHNDNLTSQLWYDVPRWETASRGASRPLERQLAYYLLTERNPDLYKMGRAMVWYSPQIMQPKPPIGTTVAEATLSRMALKLP